VSAPTRAARPAARALVLAALVLVAGAFVLLPPLPQDPAYHRFADQRSLGPVPNALNVLSNAPFVLVGLAGLALAGRPRASLAGWERPTAAALFAALVLTGVGSAYYHAAPTDATLVWDRLPLAVVFMALFALVLADRADPGLGRTLVVPALVVGVASVGHWHLSGDLRLYALVQFGPLVAIPLLLALRTGVYTRGGDLALGLGCYIAAKLFEVTDAAVFAVGGVVSGHTLKHLVSAAGTAAILSWLARRERR
jgi:hypothetical protein